MIQLLGYMKKKQKNRNFIKNKKRYCIIKSWGVIMKKLDNKIRLVKLLEYLQQKTDEYHSLSTNDLIDLLEKDGLEADRKTIYSDIEILNKFGYEVLVARRRKNEYYIPAKNFEVPELKVLIDAVISAKFITSTKTKELVEKISDLGGSYRSTLLKRNLVYDDIVKHSNEVIYYSVDRIEEAIKFKKQIKFKYFDYDTKKNRIYRKDGEYYTMCPLATVINNENYYLIVYNEKYNRYNEFRIDRMDMVTSLDIDIPSTELVDNFNVKQFVNSHFSMYSVGEVENVQLVVKNELVNVVLDKFGESTKIDYFDENNFRISVNIRPNNTFFGWLFTFKNDIKILYPSKICDEYKKMLSDVVSNYED